MRGMAYLDLAGPKCERLKVQQIEKKIQALEGELSEAATMGAALFSVVTEHRGSVSKVHTPARRLSRFYHHACSHFAYSSRTNAARSIISGLIFMARASGSDVPRLTFWLSNSVMLRAITSQTILKGKTSLKSDSFPRKNGNKTSGKMNNEESIYEFISGLENVDGWIFSRIVESLWWQQSLWACMRRLVRRKVIGKKWGTDEIDQVDVSMEIWKRAFKDACERLCPIRGGGNECGCLLVLAKLVMEQLVARLYVAMFNAIIRESSDEFPTDPLSDPIRDASIGNWCRWPADLFGLEENEPHENGIYLDDVKRPDISLMLFNLLNALIDLKILPKDMLLDKYIRKEVCPVFSGSLIKTVLYNFLPDEFCPDPVPDSLMDSLDSENSSDEGEEFVNHRPLTPPSPLYHPPLAASIMVITGDNSGKSELRCSSSSLIDKAHTSDDELDKLNLPWLSILSSISLSPMVSSAAKSSLLTTNQWNNQHAVCVLLRDIWMNYE